MNKIKLTLGASAFAMLLAGSANAGTLWIARLSQANENPPTGAPFTGTGFLILNDAETTATITATHNINIPLTGGHIHRGTATVNGPIIFPFPNPASPVGPQNQFEHISIATEWFSSDRFVPARALFPFPPADPHGWQRRTQLRQIEGAHARSR